MLLPTMNQTEIILQVKRDYEKIDNTTRIRLGSEYDRERRKLKIDKRRTYSKVYTIKTNAKNNWIIVLSKSPSHEFYTGPDNSLIWCAVTYFYDQTGLKVLKWRDPYLQVYSAHFFQRFNQRLKLNLNNPSEIIKRYFVENVHIGYHYQVKNGIAYFIGFTKEGLQLGTLQEGDVVLWRTFVSADLVRADQHAMKDQLISRLHAEWIKAVKEHKSNAASAKKTWDQLEILQGNYNPL